jgi:hypothetical protein
MRFFVTNFRIVLELRHYSSLPDPFRSIKFPVINLYLSILLHYVTYNVTVSVFMQYNIYYTIFLLSFSLTTCFGLTWPSSSVDHCAKLSHCTLYCFSTTRYDCLYKRFLKMLLKFRKIFVFKTRFLKMLLKSFI